MRQFFLPLLLPFLLLSGRNALPVDTAACLSARFHDFRTQEYPYKQKVQLAEETYLRYAESTAARSSMPEYSIPLVVYVIGDPDGASSGPLDAQILDGIDRLNAVFAGQDACSDNTPGPDAGIRFCLASRDALGDPTDGILRSTHPLHRLDLCTGEEALKKSVRQQGDRFPHAFYLNLYLVSEITASCITNGDAVAGFAAYPAAHGTAVDGIVVEESIFSSADCHLFKVLVHESGHYLNLLHTFEGGCKNDDCLTDGDRVCDTPPDAHQDIYPSHPCVSGEALNSCSSDVNPSDPNNPFLSDQDDLSDNYMDYAPPVCARSFTPGQAIRMQAALDGPRASLLASEGCLPPCTDPVSYNLPFTTDTLPVGAEIQIDPDGPMSHPDWYWTVDGEILPGSSLHWTANTPGIYTLILHATHSEPGCSKTDTVLLYVYCPLEVTFTVSDLTPEVGDTLYLSHPPTAGISTQWFVDGEMLPDGDSIAWLPPGPGSYQVALEYCDGECCTKSVEYLQVGSCPSGLEGSRWISGSLGGFQIDFRGESPVEMEQSGITFSPEATIVVCNETGDLLFYTQGTYIYNRNYEVVNPMLADRLWGHGSATQIMALPVPENPALYYLFYNTAQHGDFWGFDDDTTSLYYALIDMRMNGGLGGIAAKNILLARGVTEKLAATLHCNGRDWWLVTYQYAPEDRFLAWQINQEGIQTPVPSPVGRGVPINNNGRGGELNFSSDGTLLASAAPDIFNEGKGGIEAFRFDPASGVAFDPVVIRSGEEFYYGIEFSPNGNLLYIQTGFEGALRQYNLEDYHPDSIRDSEVLLHPGTDPAHSGMQTGRDGKIYIADYSRPSLSVIHRPDVPGTGCMLEVSGFPLMYQEARVGLPSAPNGIYHPDKPYLRGPRTLCDTTGIATFYVAGNCVPRDQEWQLLGSSKILGQTGDSLHISPGAPGLDTLVVTRHTPCRSVSDTLIYEVLSCSVQDTCAPLFQWIDADTLLCPGESLMLQYSTDAEQVILYNAEGDALVSGTSSILTIDPPPAEGTYQVTLWKGTGCDSSFTFELAHRPALNFRWTQYDSVICAGETALVAFSSLAERTDILRADGTWLEVDPIQPMEIGPLFADTSFRIRLRHMGWDCDSIAECHIRVEDQVAVSLDSLILCEGDSLWLWDDWVTNAGTYEKSFSTAQGCDSLSQVRLFIQERPVIQSIQIQDALCGSMQGSISVEASSVSGPVEYSLNQGLFQTGSAFPDLPPGMYVLQVRDETGCITSDTVEVIALNAPVIASVTLSSPHCDQEDGELTVSASSPASTLLYALNGGPPQSDPVFSGFPPGDYLISVLDTFGCVVDTTITLEAIPGVQITALEAEDAICGEDNGELTLHASGGTGHLYSLDGESWQNEATFSGLAPGDYLAWVLDDAGCIDSITFSIAQLGAPEITNLSLTATTCHEANGEALIDVSGGSPPYSFSLNDRPASTLPQFDGLAPGMHALTVTDSMGCAISTTLEIEEIETFSLHALQISSSSCGNPDGAIEIHTQGAAVSFTLQGVMSNTTGSFAGLPSGAYYLEIEDENGCLLDTLLHLPDKECGIYIPNVFSPNGDGINDLFLPAYDPATYQITSLRIYDRRGSTVYGCTGDCTGWDGTFDGSAVAPDVYVYDVLFRKADGSIERYSGDVTLVR